MSMDTYEFKPDEDSPRMAIKDWVTLPSDYTSMPIPADLQSISGSSDISDCSENSNTSMVLGDDVAPAKRALQTLHSVSSMHPEFQQLARLITSAASVTSKMKSETPTPEETPTAKSRRRNTDTDTRMTSEAEQLDGSRNRKNTREKQRRQEIQSKFDVLSDMLGLEPTIGQNGKTMKPDKSDILVATISHISELKKDNQDLQDEKVAITTQLFALASQLTPMRQQYQPFVASGGVQQRIKQFEGMASIPEHGAMASLPSPPQPQTHAPSTPLPPH